MELAQNRKCTVGLASGSSGQALSDFTLQHENQPGKQVAMIQKLLAGSGKARQIMPADQPRKRLLPSHGEPLQLFGKRAVDEWFLSHAPSSLE